MIVRAMKAGAAEFLIKPLTDDVLLPAIRYALARSRTALDQMAVLRIETGTADGANHQTADSHASLRGP